MKSERLYCCMTEDMAKRYLEMREDVDKSFNTLRGVAEICNVLNNCDAEVVEIGTHGIGLLGQLVKRQVDLLHYCLEKKFIDQESVEKALEE